MPTTTQNQNGSQTAPAGASASSPVQEQIATCMKVRQFTTKNGNKEVYTFQLNDGQPAFDVWESEGFNAKVNDTFRPHVVVLPSAYKSKEGEARANMKPFTNWKKIGG